MKKSIKLGLAVVALAAATSAQATYTSRDLLIGFSDGTTEHIYDLGAAGSLTGGETWNLALGLSGQYGVVGATTSLAQGQHIWATSSDPNQNGFMQTGQWTAAKANVATIAGGNVPTGGGANPTAFMEPVATGNASGQGWVFQTANANTTANSFNNNYYNPNVGVGSQAYLFNNLSASGQNVSTTLLGFFTYNSGDGVLTFTGPNAVPEPATYGALAGFGLLILSIRRQFSKA